MQRFARKWAPFVAWMLVVISVWALLNRHHFDPTNDRSDAWMAFVAAVVVFVSILIMLADTAQWSIRRLGVFGLVLSVGLLYALIASVTLWHWTVASSRDYNWIRTLLLVSSPMLLVSQIRYVADRLAKWRERRTADRRRLGAFDRAQTAKEVEATVQIAANTERTAIATEGIETTLKAQAEHES